MNIIILLTIYLSQSKGKSEFKILRLIEDIPQTRLKFIQYKEEDLSSLIDERYGGDFRLEMDLNKIGRCMPLKRKKTGEQLGSARYLEIIDSIFLGRELDCSSLIDQFMEVARILKFERKGYNVSNEGKLEDKLLQQNFLLTFLKKMEIWEARKWKKKIRLEVNVEGRYLRKLRAIGMMLGSIQTIERRPYFYLVILWARSDGNSHPAGIEVKSPSSKK